MLLRGSHKGQWRCFYHFHYFYVLGMLMVVHQNLDVQVCLAVNRRSRVFQNIFNPADLHLDRIMFSNKKPARNRTNHCSSYLCSLSILLPCSETGCIVALRAIQPSLIETVKLKPTKKSLLTVADQDITSPTTHPRCLGFCAITKQSR